MQNCAKLRIYLEKKGSLRYKDVMKTVRVGNASPAKISVLLTPEESARFEAYCEQRGHKKSTLIARLIREYLNHEQFAVQTEMFAAKPSLGKSK